MIFRTGIHRKLRVAGLIVALVYCFACVPVMADEPKRVILINSFGREFKPWREYIVSIRKELERRSPWPIEISDFALVSARRADEDPEPYLVDYLGSLFSKHSPDLIVSVGAPAASFVQRHRKKLFPATPMLFTVVEQRRVKYTQLTDNDVVVAVAHDFPAAIKNILQILPDTERVLVVNGDSPLERFWQKDMQEDFRPFENKIKFMWTNKLSFEDILKRAATLPRHSAIFWHLMSADGAGVIHEGDTGLSRLQAVANAPVFSYADTFFGNGILGGPMHSVAEGSKLAVDVAIRILGGEKPGDVKVQPTGFAAPIFDWREMQRWHIAESSLPPGSTIRFRSPTFLEQYYWETVIVSIILAVQALLIIILVSEHRRRRKAEVDTRQRIAELAHMNRRATAGEMSTSIAHELNQPLGAIFSNTEALEMILESPSPDFGEMKEILADIRRDDRRATEVIRRLRSLLKKSVFETSEMDLNGMLSEVFDFVAMQASARNVALKCVLTPQVLRVNGDRIQIQQVILNIIVHGMDAIEGMSGGQRRITGSTAKIADDAAEISIYDSGPGLSADKLSTVFEPFFTTKDQGMGMGLSIARTIVEAHGGRIWAENRAGGGAVFRLVLPLVAVH